MGPIVKAVQTIINGGWPDCHWRNNISDSKLQLALARHVGFLQHQKDAFIMRTKVAEGLLKK